MLLIALHSMVVKHWLVDVCKYCVGEQAVTHVIELGIFSPLPLFVAIHSAEVRHELVALCRNNPPAHDALHTAVD